MTYSTKVLVLLSVALLLAAPARAQHTDTRVIDIGTDDSSVAADIVLLGGKIFTADPENPWVEAVAIRGDRIILAGTTEDVSTLAGRDTRRIDLEGRVAIPGLNDAHTHVAAITPAAVDLRLSGMDPTWQEVLDSLSAAVQHAPEAGWIRGTIGPSILDDDRADRFALDAVASAHPVLLTAYSGHGAILNTEAMRVSNIADDVADPVGGRWERVAGTERATGRHYEYAQFNLWRHLWDNDEGTESAAAAGLGRFFETAAGFGITSIQNMSLLPSERFVALLQQSDSPIRVRVIRFETTDGTESERSGGHGLTGHADEHPGVTVSGIKWILDGTPVERGAAMNAAYVDSPEERGVLNFSGLELEAMLRESLAQDEQLLIHVSGDRAAEAVLAAMEAIEAEGEVDWPARRLRLEHGDGLTGDLIPRAGRLGVIVVQNPSHFTHADMFAQRYGQAHAFQPLRSLLEAGIPLALGSDGPLNPYLNMMWAVTHPVNPGEALTREQAVVAYTRGSAFAEFAEDEKGSITKGYLADMAVLSQDIFTVPVEALPATTSVLTIVGGRIVHDRDQRAIEQAVENWNRAWKIGDAELAARDYADDADWTNAFGMSRKGRVEIERLLAEVFALPHVMVGESSTVAQSIRFVKPDLALVTTRVERVGQHTPSAEELGQRQTSHLRVFEKIEGDWKIVSHLISDARDTEGPVH